MVGTKLDCYWHFCTIGDQYLGQIVALLNPLSQGFDVLPPHWTMTDPMLVDAILKAMNLTFGTIVTEHPTFTWQILVHTLACIVFYSDKLKEQIQRHSCHDFSKVSILQSDNN